MCAGISSTRNDSKSSAESVDHTLNIYAEEDRKVNCFNQGTYACGGGTRDELANEFDNQDREKDIIEYNVSTCGICATNLTLSSPTEITMEQGGLKTYIPSTTSFSI